MTDIASIITQLEQQRAAITNAIEALRGVSAQTTAPKKGKSQGSNAGSSLDGRQRQAESMRAYWAAKKAGGTSPAKKATKKRALTAAGRKALSANMKRMWAAKRAAASSQ